MPTKENSETEAKLFKGKDWDNVMKITQNTMYLSYTYIKLECRVYRQMPLS